MKTGCAKTDARAPDNETLRLKQGVKHCIVRDFYIEFTPNLHPNKDNRQKVDIKTSSNTGLFCLFSVI